MRFLLALLFLNLSSISYAKISQQDTPANFWCRAEPAVTNGNYYIRTGKTLEEAKNNVREKCTEIIKNKCVVMECGQGTHPYAFTCVASKWNENKPGGFFSFGKTADEAWKIAYFRCFNWKNEMDRKWSCKVLCFPSDLKDEN